MFTFRFAISKPLVFSILGLFYYVLSVPASTDPKDLPKSLKPNPGPPVPPGTKNTGWPGISQWTSLGDSYATGVGAGDLLGMNRCVHYSDAYPLLINNDSRMPGQANGRRIWDCTCSGATTQNILDNQFLDKPRNDVLYGHRSEFGVPQIATLTAGGDDVGFLWLILYCILQIFPYNPCEKQIQRSREILQGDKFYNSLDLIIKQILIRGITAAGDGFKLFVTGYAQFFNEKTDQCDKATFSYWDPEGKNSRMLDKGLRQELNQLAKDLNSKIKAVVDNNRAWGVENVDYDAQFEGHRFCEDGVTEPDNDNPKIWFFHLNSEGNGRTQSLDDLLAAKLDPNGNKDAFYADIKKRSSTQWTGDLKPQTEDDAYTFLLSIGDGKDVKIKSALSSTIRIFHPTRPGLDTIVSQIFGAFPKWPPADQPVNRQSTQPANPIPPPMCTPPKGNLPFSQTDGVNAINKFCGEKQYWDKQIVAPVSMTDAVNKGIGVTDSFDVGGGNKLWLQLSFAEDGGCVGYFAFTVGANDNEKLKHCTDRFMPILDGCDKDNTQQKHGGSVRDVCAVYEMATVSTDAENPFPLKGTGPLGAFKCKDTDTSGVGGPSSPLAGTCACWYEALADQTAIFDPPQGGKCADITVSPRSTHGEQQPTKRSVREVPEAKVTEGPGLRVRELEELVGRARATRMWGA